MMKINITLENSAEMSIHEASLPTILHSKTAQLRAATSALVRGLEDSGAPGALDNSFALATLVSDLAYEVDQMMIHVPDAAEGDERGLVQGGKSE